MVLYLALQFSDLVLQLSPRALEGVIDCEGQIGMPLIILRGVANIDFTALRQREPDADLVQATLMVMVTWCLEHYSAGGDAAERSSSWSRCLTMMLRTSEVASMP